MRYIISGGGTGGHIFPAVAIAKAIARHDNDAQILFVGAENRMEMDIVPKEGFNIEGLPVAGFDRKHLLKNFKVLVKLFKSMRKAAGIINHFKPDVAIGVGGYASGPILKRAQKKGIRSILQEQNSYAGVTNRLLAKKADVICVAYDSMDRFFPAQKIKYTGNPLRPNIKMARNYEKNQAKEMLGFDPSRFLIVITGGSLGARTINEGVAHALEAMVQAGAAVLWQTGKNYYDEFKHLQSNHDNKQVQIVPFITDMGKAYAAADIVVARAGAGTISELQFMGTPAILIPSPNVAEDHQTKNAQALTTKNAAIMITDAEVKDKLNEVVAQLINNKEEVEKLRRNISEMGCSDADDVIAEIALKLANDK